MVLTEKDSPGSGPSATASPPQTSAPTPAGPRREQGRRALGLLGWAAALMLAGLALYYGWRAMANRDQLTDRNLRELGRIAATLQRTVDGFGTGLIGLARADSANGYSRLAVLQNTDRTGLIPSFIELRRPCSPLQPQVARDAIELCYRLPTGEKHVAVGATFRLALLQDALRSPLFDATFLADSADRVLLASTTTAALTVLAVPPDTAKPPAPHGISTVREVTVGGRDYLLFLQPLRIMPPAADAGGAVANWTVGALEPASRFRGESLSLEPPHLMFLGLLLMLAVLALPFVRIALMGPSEALRLHHLHLLALAYILAAGVLGVTVADIHYNARSRQAVDENLAAASGRLAGALQAEVRMGLGEMDTLRNDFEQEALLRDSVPRDRVKILNPLAAALASRSRPGRDSALQGRYLRYQMVTWINPTGWQQVKWTPRVANTSHIDVSQRAYFRSIKEGNTYRSDTTDAGTWARCADSTCYYLESIQSANTGERVAEISRPYCWPPGVLRPASGWQHQPQSGCPDSLLGVQSMTTHLASIDRPLLPPGIVFAVVDRDGRTLFHSDPGRNLVEDFVQETGKDGSLRALLSGGGKGYVSATYLGRRSRLYVTPLAGTVLSLILVLDDGLRSTAHLEALAVSAAVCLAWVLLLLVGFAVVELGSSARLRWLWPDLDHAGIYRPLALSLTAFAGVLLLQGVLASLLSLPLQASSLLVPPQALAVLVLGLSAPSPPRHRPDEPRARAVTRGCAWLLLGGATAWQAGLNLSSPQTWHYTLPLALAQIAAVVFAAGRVVALRREQTRESGAPPTGWYVTTIVTALTVGAVLPGFLVHRESFIEGERRLLRYEQGQVVQGLNSRNQRIRAEYRADSVPALVRPARHEGAAFVVPTVFGSYFDNPRAHGCTTRTSIVAEGLFAHIEENIPFVTDAAVALRGVGPAGNPVPKWFWLICPDRSSLLILPAPQGPMGPDSTPRLAIGVRSGVSSAGQAPWPSWVEVVALLLAGYGLLIALVRWLARKLLLIDVPAPGRLSLPSAAGDEAGTPSGAAPEIVRDALRQAKRLRRWREWAFSRFANAGAARGPSGAIGSLRRWLASLGAAERRGRTLDVECLAAPDLFALRESIRASDGFDRLTEDGVVHRVLETAAGYYGSLWKDMPDDEKLVAARLAAGAVASPENEHPTRRLLARRILVREPDLRLMNESFAEYIRKEAPRATVAQWESDHDPSAWQRLRFPILLGLAVVVVFLFVTQRSAFNAAVAILGAAALGTGTLLKFVGAMKPPGQDKQ